MTPTNLLNPSSARVPQRRRWLCVAYAFPPINRSGTHRTLAFVKHLDRLGWDATVLTVEPCDEPRDASLVDEVPASTTVLRVPWINVIEHTKAACRFRRTTSRAAGFSPRGRSTPSAAPPVAVNRAWRDVSTRSTRAAVNNIREWISRLLMTPDSRLGWIAPAVRSGLDAVRRHQTDVIYSTSPYMSAHLIGLVLARWTRLPWVADFRDPWHGNPFRELGFSTLDHWDAALEWMVLKSASHVICNTPTMTEQLCRRRSFVAGKCSTILNGYDRERFEGLEPRRIAPADDFVLTHCGQFYGPRSPHVWFAAVRRLLDQWPTLAKTIHLALIGSDSFAGRPLTSWAANAGIDDRVRVLGKTTHAESLAYMAGSDALMLAGSSGAGAELQIPNKLFEYLAVRRPIIATCRADGPIATILEDARAEALICDPEDDAMLAAAVARLATCRHLDVSGAWSGVDKYDRALRAAEVAEIFRRVSRRGAAEPSRVLKTGSILAQTGRPVHLRTRGPDDDAPVGVWSATEPHTSE